MFIPKNRFEDNKNKWDESQKKTKRKLKQKRKKSAGNIIHVLLLKENLRAKENIAIENRKRKRRKDDNLQKNICTFKLLGNL